MIVFKSTQDKVLAALQSVAGIVERRHTLPILANVLLQDARFQELAFFYQDQVLNAAREAEDAIIAFLRFQEQTERLADSARAAARTVSGSSARRARRSTSAAARSSGPTVFTSAVSAASSRSATKRSSSWPSVSAAPLVLKAVRRR